MVSSEERVRLRADPATKHLSFGDSTKVISSRWESLPQAEKTKLEVHHYTKHSSLLIVGTHVEAVAAACTV
jgi:hypothetical protein